MRKSKRTVKRYAWPARLQSDQEEFQPQFQSALDSDYAKAFGWKADYTKLTQEVGVNPRFLVSHLYHILTATGVEQKRLSLRSLANKMKTIKNRLTVLANEIAHVNRGTYISIVPPEAMLDADSAETGEYVTCQDAELARRL